jgi:beta-N-acetylhexosaminidase
LRDLMRNPTRRASAAIAMSAAVAVTAAGGLALSSCGDEEGAGTAPREQPAAQRGGETSFLARIIPRRPEQPTQEAGGVPAQVANLVRGLPLDRKVAQLLLLGFSGQDLTAEVFTELRRLDLGGLVVNAANYTDPNQLAALAGEALVIAEQEGHVAPWVMAPQEGGEFNALADLPPATAPADLRSDEEAADEAEEAAATLRPLGITGVLAPVLDVSPPSGTAVGRRAYSDEVRHVVRYARATIGAYRAGRVLSAPGHFPGLGSGSEDTRQGPSNVGLDLDQLRRRDLLPFSAAIAAGVPAIVVSNGLYVTDDFVTPATLSKKITTDLLRGELGFRGISITDDLADPPVTALTSIPEAAVQAVNAGADMLYISGSPDDQRAAYAAILRATRSGKISSARIDEAVGRILSVKRDYGIIG